MEHFPQPHKLATGVTRWRLSELIDFECWNDGRERPTLTPEQERWLSAEQVGKRYGWSRTSTWRYAREAARESTTVDTAATA